jgi:hypothetical protein
LRRELELLVQESRLSSRPLVLVSWDISVLVFKEERKKV